jgi:hypothetical protein
MAPVIHRDIVQHSPEWYAIKAGKWSASNAATIMGGLDTSGLASLIKDIAWERVHGPEDGGFQSEAMKRGNKLEGDARDWYAFERDAVVAEVGFVEHATVPRVGWSPDGLRGERHGIHRGTSASTIVVGDLDAHRRSDNTSGVSRHRRTFSAYSDNAPCGPR